MVIGTTTRRIALTLCAGLCFACASDDAKAPQTTDEATTAAEKSVARAEAGAESTTAPANAPDTPSDAGSAAKAESPAPAAPPTEAAPDEATAGADAAADAIPRTSVSPGPPSVSAARFTTAVEDREPVDAVSFLSNDQTRILFFTDLRNLNQTTVVHRWEFQGEVMAEVRFAVKSDRWRVWSSKRLDPAWLGDWRASVVSEHGEVLATEVFTYQALP